MTHKTHGPTRSDDPQTMRITSLPMSHKLCAHVLLHPVSARERVRRIPPVPLRSQDTCFRLLAHHSKSFGMVKIRFLYLLNNGGTFSDIASSSFTPRAPRHIYCDWVPLGLISTGGMKGVDGGLKELRIHGIYSSTKSTSRVSHRKK